jgi:U3 small nucleolar RNA-associated protein 5
LPTSACPPTHPQTKAVGRRITGDKHGASALALGANGLLAVARTRIHLIDAASGERVKKISAGHAASVKCLAFAGDGAYLAASAEGSRYVNVFDCRVVGGERKGAALATLALDGVPKQLGLRVEAEADADGAVVFTVLAVCDDGAVRIVRQAQGQGQEAAAAAVNGDGPSAPVQPAGATLRVVKAGGGSSSSKKRKGPKDAPGLAACLVPGQDWRCALIHGTEASPLFERVAYATGGGVGALLPLVALAAGGEEEEEGQGTLEKGSQKRKRGEGAAAVAPEDPTGKRAAVDGSMAVLAGTGGAGGGAEQRLSASQRTIGSRLGEMAAAASASAASAAEEVVAGVGGRRAAPKADSLVTVLSQALKSSDEDLLEQCLVVHDAGVISNTVQLLPPQLTLSLVETLVHKLEKRPNRAATICPWVRFLLLHHTSYLVSVPALHKRLAGLHQLATRRVAVLPRLLGLSGRLELMLSQISKHGDARGGGGGEGEEGEVDVYDDNAGSGEEEESEEGLAAEEESEEGMDEMDEEEEEDSEQDEDEESD